VPAQTVSTLNEGVALAVDIAVDLWSLAHKDMYVQVARKGNAVGSDQGPVVA
jgi:hypothetical protein